ncbi:universal stress protein [Nocardia sp. NPDC059239]|uniref:universal stress protein n=1 Tax=unclassified Nocardia TaxID=2637762 RepID=UPI0036C21A73
MTDLAYDDPHRLASAAVVVGADGSDGAALAVRWAADFAAARGRELQIVHGLDLAATSGAFGPYEVVAPPILDSVRAHGRAVLARAELAAREQQPGLRIVTCVSGDTGAELLIKHSASAYATVIGATGDVGTLGHLGSTLLAVTSHAAGKVVVVRPETLHGRVIRDYGPVVVGVDGSPTSEDAVEAAFAEASERGTELVAVHIWTDWTSGRYAGDSPPVDIGQLDRVEHAVLAERLAGWQEKYPDVEVTRKLYLSGPAERLMELSQDAQLVVVGNRGRGGFLGLLLGSTAHWLVQHAHCPVMVVHPEHGGDGRR